MKIAITGACGVVGRCVIIHALASGHEVIGIDAIEQNKGDIDSNKYAFVQADLRDYETCLKLFADCHALIHLAAIRWPGDGQVKTHNTCGTFVD